MESVEEVPVAQVDSTVNKSVSVVYSEQKVPVVVLDSVVDGSVSVVYRDCTSGPDRQYCQKFKWRR